MELTAEKREETGKQAKSLKTKNRIPAVIFGPGVDSINISLNKTEFKKVFNNAGETDLINVDMGGKSYKILIRDVQYNPISLDFIHAGLYAPNLKEKIHAEIPVEVIGEEINPLVKNGEAMVLTLMETIEVRALPTDLPHQFTVDVSTLEKIGDGVTAAQLSFDKEKVELIDIRLEDFVVRLDSAQMEEEAVAAESEEEAVSKIEATKETAEETEEEGGKEPTKEKK